MTLLGRTLHSHYNTMYFLTIAHTNWIIIVLTDEPIEFKKLKT